MKHMSNDDTNAFYDWLDTFPKGVLHWDLVEVQEGLRVINFYVQEEEALDDD